MKSLLVVMLIAVLGALGSAGFFMLKKRDPNLPNMPEDKRMARALALRVALSVAIFLLIMLGWALGWLKPSGIPMGV